MLVDEYVRDPGMALTTSESLASTMAEITTLQARVRELENQIASAQIGEVGNGG
jgi:uncharacterized protein YlxW (UPF0749 family)